MKSQPGTKKKHSESSISIKFNAVSEHLEHPLLLSEIFGLGLRHWHYLNTSS